MINNTLRQPSHGARWSIFYITGGTLVVIWTLIWYYFMWRNGTPSGDWKWYICTGFCLSGLAVIIIGILIGRIGREAQSADVPVGEVTAAAVTPQPNPTTTAPAQATTVLPAQPSGAVPAAPGAATAPVQQPPAVTPGGQPVTPVQQVPAQQPVPPRR